MNSLLITMVACERCGRGEAEWRCQTCGKIVCENCARPTEQGVFCVDHVPISATTGEVGKKKGPGAGASVMKSLFMVMLVLTLGLGLIVFIGEFFISKAGGIPSADGPGMGIIDTIIRIRGSGTLIIVGMSVLTVLLGMGYLLSRRAG